MGIFSKFRLNFETKFVVPNPHQGRYLMCKKGWVHKSTQVLTFQLHFWKLKNHREIGRGIRERILFTNTMGKFFSFPFFLVCKVPNLDLGTSIMGEITLIYSFVSKLDFWCKFCHFLSKTNSHVKIT